MLLSANLALKSEATLSSTLGSLVKTEVVGATDGHLATCVRTAIEHDPWLLLQLSQRYSIENVILRYDFSASGGFYRNCNYNKQ